VSKTETERRNDAYEDPDGARERRKRRRRPGE
jgi:hypothetical protein